MAQLAIRNIRKSFHSKAVLDDVSLELDEGEIVCVFGPSGLKRVGNLLAGDTRCRPSDVTSVVGGARLAGEAVQSGNWDFFFEILVILNVFVGMVNLAPLPPLDGGHLAALAYEKIRRRKPDLRKLVPVSTVVAAFLILFSLSLIYIDITNPIPNPFR